MAFTLRASLIRALILTLLAAVVLHSATPAGREARFEIDEAEWLTISIATARQAWGESSPFDGIPPSPYRDEEGNPWKIGIHRSTFGFMNPLLPKLVFGGVSLALGHDQYDPAVFPRFAKELGTGRRQRALLTVAPPLLAVRHVILVLASVSAALLFLIAQRIGGWSAGILSFSLFLASPVVTDHATRIRTDFFPVSLSLLALTLVVAAPSVLSGARGSKACLRMALGLGLLAGFAVGSKLNGALLALMVGAWIVLAQFTNREETSTPRVLNILLPCCLAGAATIALFFAFSPHLWPAPIENLGSLFEAWDGDLLHQKDKFGDRLGRADSIPEHFSLAARAVTGEYEPLFAHAGLRAGLPLLALGLFALGLTLRNAKRRAVAAFVLVYVLFAGIGTTLWLPFGRDNFYLGLAPVVALLEGLALSAPLIWLRRTRRQRQVSAATASTPPEPT